MRHAALLIVTAILYGCDRSTPPTLPVESQAADHPTPVQAAALHNAFRVSERVYSGSSPEGETGFAELQRLGIKTVISVDGARPDVETARRYGLTYVHLPFGYDGIPRDRVLGLARAVQTQPGPVYVHCHHGTHRGPAAVAAILLCIDPTWDTERAEEWLRTAGTDQRYTGLVGLPRSLKRPSHEELVRVPTDFPSTSPVADLTRLMVEVDSRWEHLKLAKSAAWAVPTDHPDVDPPHEALQLAEQFREARRLESTKGRGPAFDQLLSDAEAAAWELERALRVKPADSDRADRGFARAAAICSVCHDRFRDRPATR